MPDWDDELLEADAELFRAWVAEQVCLAVAYFSLCFLFGIVLWSWGEWEPLLRYGWRH
jgi:hypothetical protein